MSALSGIVFQEVLKTSNSQSLSGAEVEVSVYGWSGSLGLEGVVQAVNTTLPLFNPLQPSQLSSDALFVLVPVWVWVSTISINNTPRAYPSGTGTSRQRTLVVAEELVLVKTELIRLIGEE